jgi:hypothetical protein
MKQTLIVAAAATLMSALTFAQDSGEQRPERENRRPPEVALQACASAVAGDQCSFEGRHGETLQGICAAPDDKPLACRPEGGPPQHSRELR